MMEFRWFACVIELGERWSWTAYVLFGIRSGRTSKVKCHGQTVNASASSVKSWESETLIPSLSNGNCVPYSVLDSNQYITFYFTYVQPLIPVCFASECVKVVVDSQIEYIKRVCYTTSVSWTSQCLFNPPLARVQSCFR